MFVGTYDYGRWEANKQRDDGNVGIDVSTVHASLKDRKLLGRGIKK